MACSLRTLFAWGATLGAHGFALDDANALVQIQDGAALQPERSRTGQCTGLKVLDFSLCGEGANSLLTRNNLGGEGPDNHTPDTPEEMRFEKVSEVAGIGWLDLVIVNVSSWKFASLENGHGSRDHCLAAVNILTDSETSLNFRLTKHGHSAPLSEGGPFEIPFTILDVDSQNRQNEEYVIVDTYMEGDLHTKLSGDHAAERVNVEPTPTVGHYRPIRISAVKGREGIGDLSDNPRSPQSLELAAEERAVEVRFRNRDVAEWQVTAGSTAGDAGRHFFFGGSSNIMPQTTTATTPCPCTEYPETLVWGLCKDDAYVATNNLGGMGPDLGKEPVIRYGKVASVEGSWLDLVVEAMGPYVPHDVLRGGIHEDGSDASLHGCYGAINIAADTSVDLNFTLVNHNTNDRAVVGRDIRFNIYDLDSGPGDSHELVSALVPAAPGHMTNLHKGSNVDLVDEEPLTVRSRLAGNGDDNAHDNEEASEAAQYTRSAGVTYVDTASWQIRLRAAGGKQGRNFLFQGCRDMGPWLQFPKEPFGRARTD